MCFKKIKVNWKEVLKIAPVMGFIAAVLDIFFIQDVVILTGSVVITAFILNRRLKKGEGWGLLLGFIINLVVYAISLILLDLISIYLGI
jgi:hypothetical protein